MFPHSLAVSQYVSSEHLKTVPDLLETLMSEKRLLQAAILLVGSLKIINKSDMLEIGAVSDLRGYLNSQEFVRITSQTSTHFLTQRRLGTKRNPNRRITESSLSKIVLVRISMGRICAKSTKL